MFFWSKVANFLRLPEPYKHLDGWVYDGEHVFADTLCQSIGLRDREIPPADSGWWYSYRARQQFKREFIFETQRDAVEYTIEKLDRRIESLQETRERIIQDWKGHLKPVTPSGIDPSPDSGGRASSGSSS